MRIVVEVRHYVDRAGKDVFDDWLSRLADARAQAKIASRINRLAAGNFGDCRPLRQGLSELRINWGDRKSTRLNSSHGSISYAVFCLKKKKQDERGEDDVTLAAPGVSSGCRGTT